MLRLTFGVAIIGTGAALVWLALDPSGLDIFARAVVETLRR